MVGSGARFIGFRVWDGLGLRELREFRPHTTSRDLCGIGFVGLLGSFEGYRFFGFLLGFL